jgi:hypothetical protein
VHQIAKVSGTVDKTVVPDTKTIEEELDEAKELAKKRCIAAGGKQSTIEIVEVDVVPMSYVTNGATRLIVRVVGDLVDGFEESEDIESSISSREIFKSRETRFELPNGISDVATSTSKGSSYDISAKIDLISYRPRIEGDYWYLSELDLEFLQDGTGVLGVGSCGEPYPAYIACLLALRNGEDITIRRQDTFPDDAILLVAGFMVRSPSDMYNAHTLTYTQGSPSVYLERIPGINEFVSSKY